jgi:restriction system protein
MARRAWMVRAGRESQDFDLFYEHKGVAIWWLENDELATINDKEEIKDKLRKWDPDANPNVIGNWAGQIWRFYSDIEDGDYLLTYNGKTREYAIGISRGGYKVDKDKDIGYYRYREVEDWSTFKRDRLSKKAQNSLGSLLTVFEVSDFIPEFEAILRGEEPPVTVEESTELNEIAEEISEEIEERLEQTFRLEKHLLDFLTTNWEATSLGPVWEIYKEEGRYRGVEFDTGEIGRIDILAHSRKELGWLVIELKRGQTEDETVGQVLRYMGWVQENMADEETPVKGLIICQEDTPKLRYALKNTNNVDLMLYEVSFSLKEPPKEGKKNG